MFHEALLKNARRPRSPRVFFILSALACACGTSPDDRGPGAETGGTFGAGGLAIPSGGAGSGGSPFDGTGGGPANVGGLGAGGGSGNSTGGLGSGGAGDSPSSGGAVSGGGTFGGGGGAGGGASSGGASGGETGSGGGPAEYTPCPPSGPCIILPLGDSITEGFGSSGGGYRVELFKQALEAQKEITFVGDLQNGPTMVSSVAFPRRHQGHGGFTIDSGQGHSGISGEITNSALSDYDPHIVLLMIGTNDINGNVDVQNAPTRLGNLIDSITSRSPDTLVVVASIIPVLNTGTNARVVTYNTALAEVAEERAADGDHVMFLDNYEAIASQPNYSSALMGDSLHPNDAGYAVLGRSFYSRIEPLLP